MSGDLPPALRAGLEALAARFSGRALAEASARLTGAYRSGRGTRLAAPVDAAAYAVVRMPATYAAVAAALAEAAARAAFLPASLLDLGCGPGTAAWAAAAAFPSLERATLVDAHPAMIALGRELAGEGPPALACAAWTRAALADHLAAPERADLVVSAYALNEIPLAAVGPAAARMLAASSGLVAIVEPGTPQGFAVVAAARAALLAAGARILAPCPHDGPCPLAPPDWCHFSARLPRLKAHKAAKGADVPFEDERFAYVAAARPGIPVAPAAARILRPPKSSKAADSFHLCTPAGLAERTVPTREREASRAVRRLGWGDAFPADL